jgi:hypothetical protein
MDENSCLSPLLCEISSCEEALLHFDKGVWYSRKVSKELRDL